MAKMQLAHCVVAPCVQLLWVHSWFLCIVAVLAVLAVLAALAVLVRTSLACRAAGLFAWHNGYKKVNMSGVRPLGVC